MPTLASCTVGTLAITALLFVTGAAWAQQPPPIKPGLWQMQMQHDDPELAASMREMEQEMKNMPPEQRRQMEAMLKQHGVGLGSPGTVKTCLTKEDLARNDWQSPQHQGNCRTTSSTRTGNTWKFHTSCPAPDATEIDGEVTFVSPDRYTMKSAVTTTEDGQKKTRRMTATSTWLGADCGGIKPSGRSQTK